MSFSKAQFTRSTGKTGAFTTPISKTGKRDLNDTIYPASHCSSSSPRFLSAVSVQRKEGPISSKLRSLSKPRTPKLQSSPLASKKEWGPVAPVVGESPRISLASKSKSKLEESQSHVQPQAPMAKTFSQNLPVPGTINLLHASVAVTSCESEVLPLREKLLYNEDGADLKIEADANSGQEEAETKKSSPSDFEICQHSSLADMPENQLNPEQTTVMITELEEYVCTLKQLLEAERATNKDLLERLDHAERILTETTNHSAITQDLQNSEKQLRAAAELTIASTTSENKDQDFNCPNRSLASELQIYEEGNVDLNLKLNPFSYEQPTDADIDHLRRHSREKAIELLAIRAPPVAEWKRKCENSNAVLWAMGAAQLITLFTLCFIKWKR